MNYPEKIAELLQRKKMIDAEVVVALEGLKDKSVPLDERWDIFSAFAKAGLLQTESYGDGFVDILGDNITLYDDFHRERHETVDFVEMYHGMLPSGYSVSEKLQQADIDAWRERVLEAGYGSFEFDW